MVTTAGSVNGTGPTTRDPNSTKALRERIEKLENNVKRLLANRTPAPTLLHQLANAGPMSAVDDKQVPVYNKAKGTYEPGQGSGSIPATIIMATAIDLPSAFPWTSAPFAPVFAPAPGLALANLSTSLLPYGADANVIGALGVIFLDSPGSLGIASVGLWVSVFNAGGTESLTAIWAASTTTGNIYAFSDATEVGHTGSDLSLVGGSGENSIVSAGGGQYSIQILGITEA